VSGLTWTMPNGALAPGKVLPKFWVPTNGCTRLTGSSSAARAWAGVAAPPQAISSSTATSRRVIEKPPVNDVIVR